MTETIRTLTRKVCLLGDYAVGKTSLMRRFVEGRFDSKYLSTIGVKVDRKVLQVATPDGMVDLTLMLWDLAGHGEGGRVVPGYYRGAAGAIIVCDVTRSETLPGLSYHAHRFLAMNLGAQVVMAANKVDLVDKRCVSDEELAAAALEHEAPLFLTSAKTGEQVEAMFERLGLLLVTGAGSQRRP